MNEVRDNKFAGPLFIVGMPRSGTKLLRSLLNEHSLISIPNVETHFIPYWYRNWHLFGDLSQPRNFALFYKQSLSLPYFQYLSESTDVITLDEWYHSCADYSVAGVFEALVRHDSGFNAGCSGIWGDKTPSYLVHMPLLKQLFPTARFIHIVRDVRDYCLSSRQAWGKNIFRSAQAWNDRLKLVNHDTQNIVGDVLTIRYEDLLSDPRSTLQDVCDFIDIRFEENMMTLSAIPENLGDTTGATDIVIDNKTKYIDRMDAQTREYVESLAGEMMIYYGYPVSYKGSVVRLPSTRLFFYRILDGINLVLFEVKTRGFLSAIKLRWKLFTTTNYNG